MTPITASEAVLRDGFTVIPFPGDLADLMIAHIRQRFRTLTGVRLSLSSDLKDMTRVVANLSDDTFLREFRKPLRFFPDQIGAQVARWVEGLATFLGGRRAGINYISRAERDDNPTLRETSYDIFWRCVRAGKPDVGAPHADFKFWEINRGTPLEAISPFGYDQRWKVWVPLMGCGSGNSLQVLPGSHREQVPFTIAHTAHGVRPAIQPVWLAVNQPRFICPLPKFDCCCVLFHDRLVHRGPINDAANLRISGEFTILLKL